MGDVLGGQFLIASWCMVGFTGVLVAMRLYVQLRLSQTFRTRSTWVSITLEGLVIFAWVSFLSQAIMDTFLHHYEGFSAGTGNLAPGNHIIESEQIALKIVYAETLLYVNPMYAVKCHMLLFYWTYLIHPSTNMRKTFRCLQFTTLFVLIAWPLEVLLLTFYCEPIRDNWSLDENQFCGPLENTTVFWLTYGPHLASDLMVYFLPIPVLRTVKFAETRKKVFAFISFGFGFICIFMATAQIITNLVPSATMAMNWTFASMEQTWSLLVVCVPAFKLFLKGWEKRPGGSTTMATENTRQTGATSGTEVTDQSRGGTQIGTKLDKNNSSQSGPLAVIREKDKDAADSV